MVKTQFEKQTVLDMHNRYKGVTQLFPDVPRNPSGDPNFRVVILLF